MQATAAIQAFLPASSGAARRPTSSRQIPSLRLVQQQQRRSVAAQALNEGKTTKGQGGISRDEEPEEYWKSQAERDGKSPFQDPLAQIGILAILFPFIFLGVAITAGWVDLAAGR